MKQLNNKNVEKNEGKKMQLYR